jgi:divalent metal cation (Fe/Co/Zn/Cd) transporter
MRRTRSREDSKLRTARTAQSLTSLWMVIEGVVAVAVGIRARSVTLTAFGADSFVEILSAAVVLHRLLGRTVEEARDEHLSNDERRASRIVGFALYAVAGYIVLSSIATIATRTHAEASTVGMSLMGASILVMVPLWRWRLRLADELRSPALKADAACSAVCVYMAATSLAGLVLNRLLGWWWTDPAAALVLIWWIRREANEALETARTGERCDCCE